MHQLSISDLFSILPLAIVVAAGHRVSVRSRAVFTSVPPLAIVRVSVHVCVFAAAVSLVVTPLAYDHKILTN